MFGSMHRKSTLEVKLFASLVFSSPWPNKNLQCLAVLNYLTGGREPGRSLKQDVGVVKITQKSNTSYKVTHILETGINTEGT